MKNAKTPNDIDEIIDILKKLYPIPACELNYTSEHEFLIAVRLSAQCTDKRVNLTTPALFDRFKTIEEFANADISEIEGLVKSCGFYRTKARDIKGICKALIERGGKTPSDMNELLALPGVGRKTANLVRGELYSLPAIVTDTHVMRISRRLGLTANKEPHKIEDDLVKIIPESESLNFCHRLVLFGRETCKSQNPKCKACDLIKFCVFIEHAK